MILEHTYYCTKTNFENDLKKLNFKPEKNTLSLHLHHTAVSLSM